MLGKTFELYHRTPKELLLSVEVTKDFENIYGSIMNHGDVKNFYAPASSEEDVKKVSEIIYK